MKGSIILSGIIFVVLIGCKQSATKELNGVYVNKSQSEYSVAYDTLIVADIVNGKSYEIEERIGYQRIKNGNLQKKQFKQEKWQATWDESKSLLAETQYGRQLFFKSANKTLVIKNSEFVKIK
jgi:hypothetical protein